MRTARLPLRGLTAAALATVALAGCGTGESDRVRAKVEQFAAAAARDNYGEICDQVLATPLLEQLAASGISCESAMRTALGTVSQVTVGIGRITVSGAHARVLTLSAARGQRAVLAEIDLVQESGGWRISALSRGGR
ncbi:MAG: hypothetical protein M3Y17_14805 [Actinomycetota bacterium]|nr:hypothetical protein [Actinomycetota bacterium]